MDGESGESRAKGDERPRGDGVRVGENASKDNRSARVGEGEKSSKGIPRSPVKGSDEVITRESAGSWQSSVAVCKLIPGSRSEPLSSSRTTGKVGVSEANLLDLGLGRGNPFAEGMLSSAYPSVQLKVGTTTSSPFSTSTWRSISSLSSKLRRPSFFAGRSLAASCGITTVDPRLVPGPVWPSLSHAPVHVAHERVDIRRDVRLDGSAARSAR